MQLVRSLVLRLSGSSVEPRSRFGEASIPPATNGPYGRYPDDGTYAFRNDRFEPHRSTRNSSPYISNASQRTVSSIADARPSQSYRAPENSRRPSFESPNCMERTNYGYRSDPPLYRGPSVHTRDPSDAILDPQDGYRRPNVEVLNSVGRPTYGYPSDSSTYRSPSGHLHTPGVPQLERNAPRTPTYEWRNLYFGSPYASSAPRPPFGTPAMHSQHVLWYR